MIYSNSFWGMNMIWWLIWGIMIFWIFALPYDIPGQRRKKDSPLDILKKEFAYGKYSKEEYLERKVLLENDISKKILTS